MKLTKEERLEDLQCQGLKIIQNKSLYTFTSDSVILANFIKMKAPISTAKSVAFILIKFAKITLSEVKV